MFAATSAALPTAAVAVRSPRISGRRASSHSPYLLSGGGNSLIFRVRVPNDLRPCLGKTEYRRSLGPCYAAEAKVRALRLATAALEVFSFAREVIRARGCSLLSHGSKIGGHLGTTLSNFGGGRSIHRHPNTEKRQVAQGIITHKTKYTTSDFQGRALSSLTDGEIRAVADELLLSALKASSLFSVEATFTKLLSSGGNFSDLPKAGGIEANEFVTRLEEQLDEEDAQKEGLSADEILDRRTQTRAENHQAMHAQRQRLLLSGAADEDVAFMADQTLKEQGVKVDPETETLKAILATPPKASIPYIKVYHEVLKAAATYHGIRAQTAQGDYTAHDAEVERLEAKQEARREKRRIKVQPQTAIASQPPQQNTNRDSTGAGRKLSEAIAEMIQEKTRDGSWKPKVARMERVKFDLFQAVVDPEDCLPVASLSATHLKRYKEIILQLPRNRSKDPAYRTLKAPALIKLIESGGIPAENRIEVNTIKTYFQSPTAFLNWAAKYEYHTNPNITAILEIKSDKQPHEYRDPFTNQDITKLFNAKALTEGTTEREQARTARMERPDSGGKASRFWVPLLGLFTGARLEELAQLHTDDLVLVNRQGDARRVFVPSQGVRSDPTLSALVTAAQKEGGETLCLFINQDKPYQRLKNAASRRYVPLSPVLADDLGFLSYAAWIFQNAEQARAKGEAPRGDGRLFPELTRNKEHDNFAHELSKWFNKYRKAVGVEQQAGSGKKDFHSFRHTMARWCEQNDVAEKSAARHLGHSHDTMTFGRYSTDTAPHMLYEAITKGFSEYVRSLLDIDGLKSGHWAQKNGPLSQGL